MASMTVVFLAGFNSVQRVDMCTSYGCFGIVFSMDPDSLIDTDSGEDFEGGSSGRRNQK